MSISLHYLPSKDECSTTMLLEKRTWKSLEELKGFNSKASLQKTRSIEKELQKVRCDYKMIPTPIKYDDREVFVLYGNVPLMQKNNNIFTDLSLLNEFYHFQEIHVTRSQAEFILSISTERRAEVVFSRWKTIVKKFKQTKDSSLINFAQTLKEYSLNFEKYLQEFYTQTKRQKEKHEKNEYFRDQIHNNRDELGIKYPFIQLKSELKGNEHRLNKIIVNEKFIKTLGYTKDAFSSTILREGIPELFKINSEQNSSFLQSLLTQFSLSNGINTKIENDYYELDATLLTRSGYIKDVKVEVHLSLINETDKYESNVFYIIKAQGLPYLPKHSRECSAISEEFVNFMCSKEQTIVDFFSIYYNYNFFPYYLNIDKVCSIKEIQSEEALSKVEQMKSDY